MTNGFRLDASGYWIVKDPSAVLDYCLDWAAVGDSWLDGDVISAVDWTVAPGITIGAGGIAPSHTNTKATVWLSGGTAGETYAVTCRITTAAGRIENRSFRIVCRDR